MKYLSTRRRKNVIIENKLHPGDPRSNVAKFDAFDPNKYVIDDVALTVRTNEALTPGRPPSLTQQTIGKLLQPLTRELVEVPPRPTIDELPDAVIDHMVQRDKAFWVDKPGTNAYTLHDAYYNYGMTTEIVKPPHQEVFPRSYLYDLDCIKYRRQHACDGLKKTEEELQILGYNQNVNRWAYPLKGFLLVNIENSKGESIYRKPLSAHCRDCNKYNTPSLTPFQLAWTQNPDQRRWRYYPDLTATLTAEEIRQLMNEVGRPFYNEACQWYNKNYTSVNYNCILRKFSK